MTVCSGVPIPIYQYHDIRQVPANRAGGIIPLSADEFCDLLTSYGVKYTESK